MNRVHRVLVGVDFAKPARAAFDYALALSRQHGAELTVVHAVPTERTFNWDAAARYTLLESLRQAAEAAAVPFKVSIQQGDEAGVILLHAKARRADVIVVGTSGRTGIDRFRLGSVAEAVVHRAAVPVLVVPPIARQTGDPVDLRLDNVLAAVNLEHGSTAVVTRALSMANAQSRLTLLHVIRGLQPAIAPRYMYHLMEPEFRRHLARDAWRRLSETIPVSERATRNVRARVATGDIAAEISRIAKEMDAGVIVVGVTPRGLFGRMFGSTTTGVLRAAERPVLAIPLPAARTSAPVNEARGYATAA